MSNEFQHKSVGSQMTQTEYEHTDGTGHIFDSQAAGDILFASSTTVLSRLGIGTAGKVLAVNSGASAPEYVAALTGVTSVLNTALVIGRDADNDIDFATDNTILFRADGADQIKLTNGALLPVTDDDIDLGSSSLQFKDGHFDGTVEADAITVGGTAVLTGGAETAITSILNTSLVLGRDADNDIDFGTDNNIIFRAGAQDQVKLIDGALAPVTDNDVDLGTSSLEFKDAFFDGTVTTDALAMATNTSGNLLIGNGSAFASTAVGDLSEISTVANDDVFLAVDTSGGGLKKITRSAIVSGLAASGAISNVVEDTSPQLGGNLDVVTNSIITDASNRNIKLQVHGTGKVEVRGNTDSSGTNPGTIILNCEQNTHGQTIKAQAHSASVTNTLTLPAGGDGELVSTVATQTLTNKTLTTPVIAEIDSLGSGNITLDAEANIELNADGGTITFKDASASLGTITSSGYSGTAAVATTVTITDNESTDEDNAIIFTAGGDVDGGNIGLESDGTLTYNPSTGKVTATGFVGTLTGNVTGNASGTAATVTGAAQSNITSLGILTTLTVDNVITNGTTIGHTDDTDLMTLADGVLSVAGTLDVTGSVETATIDFTDGDNAITIADGGGTTFPQAATFTSGLTANDNISIADGKHINLTTPLLAGADHTATGTTAQMLAGAAITAFQLVCIHSTTQEVVPADASAAATSRAIGIALADISDTATGTILFHGFVRDDTFNFTTGGVVFLSETTGALTQTAPTTSDAFVQAVGIALEPDVVFINPSVDVIQHA